MSYKSQLSVLADGPEGITYMPSKAELFCETLHLARNDCFENERKDEAVDDGSQECVLRPCWPCVRNSKEPKQKASFSYL